MEECCNALSKELCGKIIEDVLEKYDDAETKRRCLQGAW